MEQLKQKSLSVFVLAQADKEICALPLVIREKVIAKIQLLGSEHEKIRIDSKLILRAPRAIYELRMKDSVCWRILFCYTKEGITILSVFKKKKQKTPMKEIQKAKERMIRGLL